MRIRRIIITAAAIGVLGGPQVHAADLEALALAGEQRAPGTARSAPFVDQPQNFENIKPWIHHSMPECLRTKLEAAFEIAADRVREVPECAGLFATYGADGLELLAETLYFPAGLFSQTTRCRHSFAITVVGENTTWVCRKAIFHSDEKFAMALIHEALHHAGLPEYPHTPGALLSGQINNMVLASCDLR